MREFIIGFSSGILFLVFLIYHFSSLNNEITILYGAGIGTFTYFGVVKLASLIPDEKKTKFLDKFINQ